MHLERYCNLIVQCSLVLQIVIMYSHMTKGDSSLQVLKSDNNNKFHTFPLYQGFGSHYIELHVGKPLPQRQTLVVDTGSYITAFPCKGCGVECDRFSDHMDQEFAPNLSNTYEISTCPTGCAWALCYDEHTGEKRDGLCTIKDYYVDGQEWDLSEATDWVQIMTSSSSSSSLSSLSNTTTVPNSLNISTNLSSSTGNADYDDAYAFKLAFSCMTGTSSQVNFQQHMADGILAMGARSEHSFIGQMYRENMIALKQFSLCVGIKNITSKGEQAGVLAIGGLDARLHKTPMLFAKETGIGKFYEVYVKNIYLRVGGGMGGGILSLTTATTTATTTKEQLLKQHHVATVDLDPIDLNARGVALKSGIPHTYLSSSISKAFRRAWREVVGEEFTKSPLKLSRHQVLESLPVLFFQLQGLSSIDYSSSIDPNDASNGLAGDMIDPTSPYDVIVAFSPAQYMEYIEDKAFYVSRLYLDEPEGTVLGDNFLQGRDVFFDLDRRLVGFAESECIFASLAKKMPVENEITFLGSGESSLPNDSIENESTQSVSNAISPLQSSPFSSSTTTTANCTSSMCKFFVLLGISIVPFNAVLAWNFFRLG